MAGPDSSYSALEIHIDWNVDNARGLPAQGHTPTQRHRRDPFFKGWATKTNAQNHLPSTTPREQPIERRRRRRLLNRNRISLLLFTSGELLL